MRRISSSASVGREGMRRDIAGAWGAERYGAPPPELARAFRRGVFAPGAPALQTTLFSHAAPRRAPPMIQIQACTPPERLLLGPGPSPVAPSVLRALAQPTIGHLDPVLLQVQD